MPRTIIAGRVLPREPGSRVVAAGVAMILAQLAYRAWAVFGSWFQFDDFAFMSRLLNAPLSDVMFGSYGGHLMPGGFLLSWLNLRADPLDFSIPAVELLVLQAIVDVGALVFLVSAFGRRRGVLAPLALFLTSAISLPAFIWWAAGVNQLPFLAALWWGGWTHLTYLRTRRWRWALATLAITVVSMACYEKTLLVFLLFAFLALAYFAEGDILARTGAVLRTYRVGVLLYGVVAVSYLVAYVRFGLNYDTSRTNEVDLGPVVMNMAGYGYATGVMGGPLRWQQGTLGAVANPTQVVTLLALAVLAVVGYELAKTRTHTRRAWLLVGLFLSADVLLVTGARVSFVGPVIALEYRYQTELAVVSAMALGLALMPLLGANELVTVREPSNFLDHPGRTALAAVAVACLGVYSSTQYVGYWQNETASKTYFTTLERELAARTDAVPLADAAVPGFLMWGFSYPENLTSHVLRVFGDETYYPRYATDNIYMVANSGRIRPMIIAAQRHNEPGASEGCPFPATNGRIVIPLDGPVIGGGWWVRVSYIADAPSPVHIKAGEGDYATELRSGVHSLFFRADGEYQSVELSQMTSSATVCVAELELGLPQPLSDAAGG